MTSIRAEMGKDNVLLQGIVEADETYIGGKSRPDYDREEGEPLKRGRATAKDAVLCAIARNGKVRTQLVENVKAETITKFIKKFVDTDKTGFWMDQFRANNDVGEIMQKHETVKAFCLWHVQLSTISNSLNWSLRAIQVPEYQAYKDLPDIAVFLPSFAVENVSYRTVA